MRSFENRLGAIQAVSMLVFFVAGLGLISLALPEKAGLIGNVIAQPLVAMVDTIAAVIFLLAFLIVAIIMSSG
jgi:hypothetical protein